MICVQQQPIRRAVGRDAADAPGRHLLVAEHRVPHAIRAGNHTAFHQRQQHERVATRSSDARPAGCCEDWRHFQLLPAPLAVTRARQRQAPAVCELRLEAGAEGAGLLAAAASDIHAIAHHSHTREAA